MSQLTAVHLRKRYKARTVVHDVSLEVASGEVVGLLGPNGAGKTTCFYMIVGLVATDGGNITLDNEDLSGLPIHQRARRGLSYLPQEASIFRKLTVAENVRAILELVESDGDVIANRLDALLEDLSISHLANAPAISLSGGERRRCEIARAL
ncbi:MAG: ATP-binding cassette domain-containing protein, partial [Casimicrobiaceae bacterium]